MEHTKGMIIASKTAWDSFPFYESQKVNHNEKEQKSQKCKKWTNSCENHMFLNFLILYFPAKSSIFHSLFHYLFFKQ